jgi:ABC-2 type transport system permease protein
MLLLGVAAFGNEVSDRTLVYLTTKPLARWRIVLPKAAATLLVGGLPVAISGAVAIAIIEPGNTRGAMATAGGLLAGAAAYTAVFTWAGLALRHALVAGLVYVFVWEAVLAAYLDGIRFLSVRRFALSLVNGLDAERLADAELGVGAASVGVVLVLTGFTALAIRKLRRMDVP